MRGVLRTQIRVAHRAERVGKPQAVARRCAQAADPARQSLQVADMLERFGGGSAEGGIEKLLDRVQDEQAARWPDHQAGLAEIQRRAGIGELFDTLLLWRADVALDASGGAEVANPLNDSLTNFRVVAARTGGSGLFGTVETAIEAMKQSGVDTLDIPSCLRKQAD